MNTNDPQTTGINAGGRLERLPFTAFKYKIYLILMIVYIAEALDLGITGSTLPAVVKAFHVSASAKGLYAVASTIGVVVGEVFAGAYQDYLGRKWPLITGTLWAGFMAIVLTFSSSYGVLVVLRAIQGFGLGMIFPVIAAAIAEWSLGRTRGRGFAWMDIGLQIGYVITPFISLFILVPFPPSIGWKNVYYFSSIVSFIGFIVLLFMPESVRWLEGRGKLDKAEKTMTLIEAKVRKQAGGELPPVTNKYILKRQPKVPFSGFVERPLLLQNILIWAMGSADYSIYYLLQVYQPTWLIDAGLTYTLALVFTTITLLLTIGAKYLNGYLGDRIGRRKTILIYGVIGAIFLSVTGLSVSIIPLIVIGTIVTNFFIQGWAPVMKGYATEQFYSSVRGSGFAGQEGVWRFIGGIIVPLIFAPTLGTPLFTTYAIVLSVIVIIVVLIGTSLGKETSRFSLEEVVKVEGLE